MKFAGVLLTFLSLSLRASLCRDSLAPFFQKNQIQTEAIAIKNRVANLAQKTSDQSVLSLIEDISLMLKHRGDSPYLNSLLSKFINQQFDAGKISRYDIQDLILNSNLREKIKLKFNSKGRLELVDVPKSLLPYEDVPSLLKEIDVTIDELEVLKIAFQVTQIQDLPIEDLRLAKDLVLYNRTFFGGDNVQLKKYLLIPEALKVLKKEVEIESVSKDVRKYVKQFLAIQKKANRFADKMILKEKPKNMSLVDYMTQTSKQDLLRAQDIYRTNFLACRSTKPEINPILMSNISKVMMASAFTSATVTYLAVTLAYDKPIDKNWFKDLFFTQTIATALGVLNGKYLLVNPNWHPWLQTAPIANVAATVEDTGVSYLYEMLFSKGESDLKADYVRLVSDPAKKDELVNFSQFLSTQRFMFEGLRSALIKDLKQINPTLDESSLAQMEIAQLLDLPESEQIKGAVADYLLESYSKFEYQKKDGLIKTGSIGKDRFIFHRIWDVSTTIPAILAHSAAYNALCVNPNPKAGFMQAVALIMGYRMGANLWYYTGREIFIDQ